MDIYGVGQLWNRAASLFSRKTYQGISRHGRDDDQVELVDPNAPSSHNIRAKSSTFSLASSLTSSTFSTIRHHPTFASKFSNKKRSISNEDVTLLEIGASGVSRGGEGGSHSSSPPPPYGKSGENTDVETLPTDRDSISTQREKQWINGVYLCAKAGAVVFIINLTFIGIAAGLASRFPDNESFGSSAVIYRGDCGISKRWDTALHMIINVLSTCILAASNYCMQTLVAPTREEIDSHHAVWKWLDIGSASVKNLFAIEKYRLVLWLVLMFTATPFHLMYNSMVFESLSTNQFGVVIGPRDLNSSNINQLTTPALEKCFSSPARYTVDYTDFTTEMRWPAFAKEIANGNYDRIPYGECASKAKTTATGVRGIVALAKNLTVGDGGDAAIKMTSIDNKDIQSSSDYFYAAGVPSVSFSNQTVGKGANATCRGYNSIWTEYVPTNGGTDYKVINDRDTRMMEIEECLVIRAEEHCQLLYSPPICLTIMLAAFAKVAAMFLAAHIGRSRSPPLLTVGDAVASFMEKPDPTTKGLCWITGADVRRGRWAKAQKAGFQAVLQNEQSEPITYRRLKKRSFWGRAASGWRWLATLIMCFACIIVGCYLFTISLSAGMYGGEHWLSAETFKNWFSSDVDISDDNIIEGDTVGISMLASVVVANTPQLVITMSYYCYNAVMTSMLAASEYSSYGANRKGLRVTWPVKGSEQRSTYWLSVPYKYGVPILLLYMVLHYLISQSIFYLLLITYDPLGNPADSNKISSLGYSSMPIFLSILVGAIMVLILIVLGFWKFNSTLPITGSSSVAISAACHLPKGEDGYTAVLGKVRWGETPIPPTWAMENTESLDDRQKGHCTFTSLEVERPSLIKLYA